jgi:uncharacterized protein (DUF2062 family)
LEENNFVLQINLKSSLFAAAKFSLLLTPHTLPTLWYSRWAHPKAFVVDLQPASSAPRRPLRLLSSSGAL